MSCATCDNPKGPIDQNGVCQKCDTEALAETKEGIENLIRGWENVQAG